MSDDINTEDVGAEAAGADPEQPPVSFGERLKWERERAGLTIGDIAARLRLHPNQVRAIEQETLAKLPEAAYVRGFVRSYARVFDLDPLPLLDDLAAKLAPSSASVIDGMARQRDYSPVRAAAQEQTSRRLVVIGAVLLLVVLGALGWYAARERAAPAATSGAGAPSPATPAPARAAAQPEPTPAAAVTAPPAAPATSADSAPALEPIPPPPLLKLKFTGSSWAEVKDAEGRVLHSQHNPAGSETVIEGTPPFYVVIGDAAKVNVEVRGEAMDLTPHTRQNVARFTIN